MATPARWVRRGIVLVTTLLLMVLVVMIVTVVVYTGAGGLSLTGNFYEREAALLAADSGLQYAMARLQADATWRGNSEDTIPTARPDFSVMEKDGNVYGFLTTVYGHRSQFRIKFNYEDGDGGPDGLDNTSDTQYILVSPFVSVNNLGSSESVSVKRADVDGVGLAAEEAPYVVPKRTACLLVEGLAGWGLRDTGTSNPSAFLSNRGITRRMVEAYLSLDDSATVDSAAYAAGNMTADLQDGEEFKLKTANKGEAGKIRSLQDITIKSPSNKAKFKPGKDSEIVVGQSNAFTLNDGDNTTATVTQADSSSNFTRLTWEGITKASSGSATDAQMRGGTYVWRMDEDAGKPYLEYFDQEWTDESTLPEAGTGTRVDANSLTIQGTGVTLEEGAMTLAVTNNVVVMPSDGGAQGLAILTDPALTDAGSRPSLTFGPPEGSQKVPVLTATGSVRVEGAATGLGSITSEGDITLQGPSVLESDPETGVSLYAKGNIKLEATPGAVASTQEEVIKVLSDILSGAATSGERAKAMYLGVVEGEWGLLERIAPGQASALQQAMNQMSQEQRKKFRKAWKEAVEEGSAEALEAFLERMKKELVQGDATGSDQTLTGVVYTWRNFSANLGSGKLNLRGTVIAYGGDPGGTDPNPGTTAGEGLIDIDAKAVTLTYDPTYIRELIGNAGSVKVKRTLWATY